MLFKYDEFHRIIRPTKEIPSLVHNDLLLDFIQIVEEYFSYCKNQKNKDIVYKFFGVVGEAKTKDAIGKEYNITRERSRQIIAFNLNNIRKLIDGDNLKGWGPRTHDIRCNPLKFSFRQFDSDLSSLITEQDAFDAIARYSKVKSEAYSRFLMGVFGYSRAFYLGVNFYNRGNSTVVTYFPLIKKLRAILKTSPEPVLSSVLMSKLKCNAEELKFFSRFHPEIIQENKSYYIPINLLRSVRDTCYNILAKEGKTMHLSEIVQKVLASGRDCTELSIHAALSIDDRFLPEGKNKKWFLKEWGLDTKTIKELLVEAMLFYGKPVPLDEILNYIRKYRDVVKNSVLVYITNTYEELFCKFEGNLFGLRSWISNQNKEYKRRFWAQTKKRKGVLRYFILKRIKEILKEKKEVPISDLIPQITEECRSKFNKCLQSHTLYRYINDCNEFKKKVYLQNRTKRILTLAA